MSDVRNLDLDAAEAEYIARSNGVGPTLTKRGKVYQLPPELNGDMLFALADIQGKSMTEQAVVIPRILESMLGTEVFAELRQENLSLREIMAILNGVPEMYGESLGELQGSPGPSEE